MNKDCVIALLSGLGVGAGIGMLTASRPGEETRSRIRHKVREGGTYLKDQSNNIQESAAELLDKGTEGIRRHTTAVAQAIETGKRVYRETSSAR
jgi:gas vesicle protein